MLANAFRERLEKNPESVGTTIPIDSLSDEEKAVMEADRAYAREHEYENDTELAMLEIEARARELNEASQKS